MKKPLLFLFSSFLGLIIFVFIIKRVNWLEIKETLDLSLYKWILIIALSLLIWLIACLRWKMILKFQGINISFWRLFEVNLSGFAITYLLTPTALVGGEGYRAYVLKKKYFISWEKSLSSVAIERILSTSIMMIFLIVGAISFFFLADSTFKEIGLISILCIAVISLVLFLFYFKSFRKESILEIILKIFKIKKAQVLHGTEKEIFDYFHFRNNAMWEGLVITFLKYCMSLFRCWFLIFFITGEKDIFLSLALLFFLYASYSFPFPAGLGSLEVAMAFAFNSLGFNIGQGIGFAFIIRGADIIVSLFGILLLVKISVKLFTDSIIRFFSRFKKYV